MDLREDADFNTAVVDDVSHTAFGISRAVETGVLAVSCQ